MTHKTVNDLVTAIAKRAGELAEMPVDSLRAMYPEHTATRAELVRLTKEMGLTRGKIIETILSEEFWEEFDVSIAE